MSGHTQHCPCTQCRFDRFATLLTTDQWFQTALAAEQSRTRHVHRTPKPHQRERFLIIDDLSKWLGTEGWKDIDG